jgi:hypothetical protein
MSVVRGTVLKSLSGRLCAGSVFRLRNESPCAVLIKFKLRTRLSEVNVADHGKAPIVQYEPLIVEPGYRPASFRCAWHHSMQASHA